MVYMYHSFLIHSSADGHLGCFYVLAMINSAAMNIGVHMSLSDLVSLVCMPTVLYPFVCMRAKLLQSCPTLRDPIDCSPPSSSVHGILQARTLKRVAMPSWPRNWALLLISPALAGQFFTTSANWVYPFIYISTWQLDYKESWAPKNWCFWTLVLEKTLESPLDCKEI